MVWASLFCSACLIFDTCSNFQAPESTNMFESRRSWPQLSAEKCQGMTNLPQSFPMVSNVSANLEVDVPILWLNPLPTKIIMLSGGREGCFPSEKGRPMARAPGFWPNRPK
jgi:hypothetical protein